MFTVRVCPDKPVRELRNKVSTLCIWDYREKFLGAGEDGQIKKMNPFVERTQFMTATGGNPERDLFVDPMNREVPDDYDFSRLLTACENALRLGVKPFIKTGSIPMKFSENPEIGRFGVNLHVPTDMEQYYRYLRALCEAMVQKFGMDEVRSWWWGVFTEMENKEWFQASPDPEIAAKAAADIYDYTVCAITDVLGDGVKIGGHLMMTVGMKKLNMYDPEAFVRHCGTEKNARSGKPVKCDYLSFSFYDGRPFSYCTRTFGQVAAKLRGFAEKYGMHSVILGCDEGRINSGNDAKELSPRTVGSRYQAAMDADLIWQMVNLDVEWFSAWSYLSGGLMDGIKSMGSHVAENYYAMVGMTQLETDTEADVRAFLDGDAGDFRLHSVAGRDASGKTTVMAYNFIPGKDRPKRQLPMLGKIRVRIELPTNKPDGESAAVCRFVDDSANFFPHWEKDRDRRGLVTPGRWSEDSPEVMTPGFDPKKYEKYSHLVPRTVKTVVRDGVERLDLRLDVNSVVFADFTAEETVRKEI